MAAKATKKSGAALEKLRADIKSGSPENVYIFYGEETYLRDRYLEELKALLVPEGFEEFNYHRLSGKGLTVQDLTEVVEAMPMMAQHTLTVVTDMDLFRLDEGQRGLLINLLGDFPEYGTLVFVYDVLPYKRDGKMKKLCAAIGDHAQEVEFCQQERDQLLRWMKRRFAAEGHDIDTATADHLLFTCGTLMTDLVPEIGKIAAYAKGGAHHRGGHQRRGGPHSGCPGVRHDQQHHRRKVRRRGPGAGRAAADADGAYRHSGGGGQGAAAAVYRPDGPGRRKGPAVAEAAVGHEQRLSGQAPDAGGQKRWTTTGARRRCCGASSWTGG